MSKIYHEYTEPKESLFPAKPLIRWARMTVEVGNVVEKYNGKTFKLKNFPGMEFCINHNSSYDDQIVIALPNNAGDFLRCSVVEFNQNVR